MNKQYPEYLQELRKEAELAYDNGTSSLSDAEYDYLFGESATVGAEVGDVPHMYPMYSLQKHYAEDGEPPVTGGLVQTPKLDGAAVSLLYCGGILVQGLTRGNGVLGKDITEKVRLLAPTDIGVEYGFFQVTGEVVAHKDVDNSRNAAAGSLGLKELEDFQRRVEEIGLAFIAYGVQVENDYVGVPGSTYTLDMIHLIGMGFNTVLHVDTTLYPTDGEVFRLDSNEKFNELGFTAKHPRGAYAFKEKQKPVETKLLDVVWQTGKSGKCTPIALLKSVVIGEATISRATLNNMAYIEALNLEIGCTVEVIRAGEIIPCIVGRVYD